MLYSPSLDIKGSDMQACDLEMSHEPPRIWSPVDQDSEHAQLLQCTHALTTLVTLYMPTTLATL